MPRRLGAIHIGPLTIAATAIGAAVHRALGVRMRWRRAWPITIIGLEWRRRGSGVHASIGRLATEHSTSRRRIGRRARPHALAIARRSNARPLPTAATLRSTAASSSSTATITTDLLVTDAIAT